jgi:hypothetical protein
MRGEPEKHLLNPAGFREVAETEQDLPIAQGNAAAQPLAPGYGRTIPGAPVRCDRSWRSNQVISLSQAGQSLCDRGFFQVGFCQGEVYGRLVGDGMGGGA